VRRPRLSKPPLLLQISRRAGIWGLSRTDLGLSHSVAEVCATRPSFADYPGPLSLKYRQFSPAMLMAHSMRHAHRG
jgi:hypothetical protein